MAYMKDSTGKRLDSFAVADKANAINPNDTGMDVIAILGQSNAAGGGGVVGGIDLQINPTHPRIFQYAASGTYYQQKILAVDPLYHPTKATSIGPGMPMAREWLKKVPANRDVLLVPCALGSTGFTPSGGYTWDVADVVTTTNLATNALSLIAGALASGANSRLVGVVWVQGENDASSLNQATYAAKLDALIAAIRAQFGATVPFVVGQMVPSYIAANAATYGPINAAHIDTPNRNPYSAFVYGPTFTGSVNGASLAQAIHYSAWGNQSQGAKLADALFRLAPANIPGSNPAAPASVAATQSGTSIDVTWVPAPGRATDYLIESNTGSGWSTLTRAQNLDTSAQITGLSTSAVVQVAVSTVNAAGTSARTITTVTMVGAPNAPTSLAAGTVASWTVPLTFTAPAVDSTHAAATSYLIQKSVDSGTTWTAAGSTATVAGTANKLSAGTAYQIRVVPVNAAGQGAASSVVSPTTAAFVTLATSLAVTINSAWGLRRLTAATGAVIRVRRDSDNTQSDIGVTAAGDLDTAALLAFVGTGSTNNGFVVTIYDQGSKAANLTQATTTRQPQIVAGGVTVVDPTTGRPAMLFDGAAQYLANSTPGAYAATSIAVLQVDNQQRNDYSNAAIYAETGTGVWLPGISEIPGNPFLGYVVKNDAAASLAVPGAFLAPGYHFGFNSAHQRTVTDTGGVWTLLEDGTSKTSGTITRATTGTFTASQFGSWGGGANFYCGYVSELIIAYASFTTGVRQAGEANQKAYFGTP